MATTNDTYVDPRENVDFEIEPGMVFTDTSRERTIVIDYADRDGGIIFVDEEGDAERDEVYMRDSYADFEAEIGAGRYRPKRREDGTIVRNGWVGQIYTLKEQYEKQSGRTAAHKVEAIEEVLDVITDDVPPDHNESVDFEAIDGIGQKAADALRANGFRTKGDVRSASTAQLMDVPYMGESNTENLLQVVDR